MKLMRNWLLDSMILRQASAEGGGSTTPGEATPPANTPPVDAGSVLFPNDVPNTEGAPPAGETKTPEGDGKTPPADDWKPYVDDPAKSAEENAAAKAEHDNGDPNSPLNKVPEDGKYEFQMPEGVELDTKLADALMPEFKDLGLTQAQAQKLVDRYAAHRKAEAEAYVATPEGAASAAAYQYFKDNGTPDTWVEAAKKDPEIGGVKWDASVSDAQRAIRAFGGEDLRQFLNATGAGNHPALIKAFANAGANISEDVPANGGGGGNGKPVEAAHIMFPDDAPKKG